MSEWEQVKLGEVLERAECFEARDESATYAFAGVYSFARGVFKSSIKPASTFKLDKIQRVRTGDFVYSKIMAWEGAFGLVPAELNKHVMSGAFVVYKVINEKLLPEFLDFYFKQPDVWQRVGSQSSGTNVRRQSLHPDLFESTLIPLPPLPEQQRIVDRVKGLLEKLAEARQLQEEVRAEQSELLQALAYRSDLSDEEKIEAGWRRMSLGEVLLPAAQREVVRADGSYPNFGIYSFGRGLFVKPNISGLDTSAQALYRVRAGQFIYSRLFAFEGSYGVVGAEFDGYYVSNEYPAFEINTDTVNIEFLSAYFSRPRLWPTLAMGSKGLGDRRQRIQPEQILRHELLVPPMRLQHELKLVYKAMQAIASSSTISGEHANALPSSILARAFAGAL